MTAHKRRSGPFNPPKPVAQSDVNVAADFINEPAYSSRAAYGIAPNSIESLNRHQPPLKPS